MTWAIERAIQQGYDSACCFHKEGEQPYPYRHGLFKTWWAAVVAKADHRDWSLSMVRKQVLASTGRRKDGEAD